MLHNVKHDPTSAKPDAKLSRRGFLRIVASLGIAGFTGNLLLQDRKKAHKVQQTRLIMGTFTNLTLIAPDWQTAAAAERAIDACFKRMSELEALLSRFQPASQVSQLNRTGSLDNPHPALLHLVRQSLQISQASAGAFDITILPVLALYQDYHARAGSLPPENEVEMARLKVDFQRMEIEQDRIGFSLPGMGITLDGIAKGYIVEVGVQQLRQHGFSDVLLEAGGDLVASGWRDESTPWQIGVQPVRPGSESLATRFSLHDKAAATSGDYWQPFTPDYTQHHILDPHTGRSSPALASATVIAPNLTLADALATTLMVLDAEQGEALAKSLGCETYFIFKNTADA